MLAKIFYFIQIFLIIAASILIIGVLLIFYSPLKIFDYAMDPLYQEISLEEAKKQPSLKIYEPSYLPEGMRIDMVEKIIEPEKFVPEISLSISDLSEDKEIFITQSKIKSDFLSKWLMPRGISEKTVLVNGIHGKLTSNSDDKDYLQLKFIIGYTSVRITRNDKRIEDSELIKIAESMFPKE